MNRLIRQARLLLLAALAIVSAPNTFFAQQSGVSLSGTVMDASGAAARDVRVVIVELGRRASTDSTGAYRIGSIPTGTFTVSFSRLGLIPQTRRVHLATGATSLDLAMLPAGIDLAPVQITATTGATRAQDSPQPTSVMEGAELRVSQATALGDVLE